MLILLVFTFPKPHFPFLFTFGGLNSKQRTSTQQHCLRTRRRLFWNHENTSISLSMHFINKSLRGYSTFLSYTFNHIFLILRVQHIENLHKISYSILEDLWRCITNRLLIVLRLYLPVLVYISTCSLVVGSFCLFIGRLFLGLAFW